MFEKKADGRARYLVHAARSAVDHPAQRKLFHQVDALREVIKKMSDGHVEKDHIAETRDRGLQAIRLEYVNAVDAERKKLTERLDNLRLIFNSDLERNYEKADFHMRMQERRLSAMTDADIRTFTDSFVTGKEDWSDPFLYQTLVIELGRRGMNDALAQVQGEQPSEDDKRPPKLRYQKPAGIDRPWENTPEGKPLVSRLCEIDTYDVRFMENGSPSTLDLDTVLSSVDEEEERGLGEGLDQETGDDGLTNNERENLKHINARGENDG